MNGPVYFVARGSPNAMRPVEILRQSHSTCSRVRAACGTLAGQQSAKFAWQKVLMQ
jgi:hypothetical protein